MNETVMRDFQRFIEEASRENFLRLREVVAASPGYTPYGAKLADANELLAHGDLTQAKAKLLALMPSHFLNPGVHTALAFVLEGLGDKAGAVVEFDLGQRCLAGILSTGDGSRERPYLVLHPDDEDDVLVNLAKKSWGQTRFTDGGREYDRHDCGDGGAVWFDITIPHAHRNHRLPGKERGIIPPLIHFSKRGVRFLVFGLVGGTLLVVVMSFLFDDWSHLKRWLSGLAVVAIAAAFIFGKQWLLRSVMLATRNLVELLSPPEKSER